MKESKDFRSGTRLLLWEKDKLSMEYEDLQMKWTEIQQTKVIFHALQNLKGIRTTSCNNCPLFALFRRFCQHDRFYKSFLFCRFCQFFILSIFSISLIPMISLICRFFRYR